MERLSDRAIEILDELHTERLSYNSEYLPLIEAAHKLSEYEATGLKPFQIEGMKRVNTSGVFDAVDLAKIAAAMNELNRYKEADSQGKLYCLPVKVGEIVYTTLSMSGWYLREKDMPYKAKVVFVGLNNSDSTGGGLFNVVYDKRDLMASFNFSDIGKTVFLSREEAEAALKQKQEAEDEK